LEKLGKFLPIWMASAAQTMIVAAGLIASKNHLMPFQYAGAFNPAVTIADSAVPVFWLFLSGFAHGDF
jgi:hypothetical protein